MRHAETKLSPEIEVCMASISGLSKERGWDLSHRQKLRSSGILHRTSFLLFPLHVAWLLRPFLFQQRRITLLCSLAAIAREAAAHTSTDTA